MKLNLFKTYLIVLSLIYINASAQQIDGVWNPSSGAWLNNGETYEINWSSTGVQSVKIEYSTNNGATWNLIANNVFSNDFFFNFYSWTIPQNLFSTTHPNSRIRVTDMNSSANAISEQFTFSNIVPITITNPNANSNWLIGTQVSITINSILTQAIDVFSIDILIDDNFADSYSTTHSITPGNSSFNILLNPDFLVPTNNAKLRIIAGDFNNFYVTSSAPFSLSFPANMITAISEPQSFTQWIAGDDAFVNWFSFGINQVKIELSTDAGITWEVVEGSANSQNNGSNFYSFPISTSGMIEGTVYNSKVRITNNDNTSNVVVSEMFTIFYPFQGVNFVESPNSNSFWVNGSGYFIDWVSYGVDFVDIEYSTNSGQTWVSIVQSEPVFFNGYNSYFWQIPFNEFSDIHPNSIIRVSDSDGPTSAVSQFFTLSNISLVGFVSPVSTTIWTIGHTVNVVVENNTGGDIFIYYIDVYESQNLIELNDIFDTFSPGVHTFQIFVDPLIYYPSDFYHLLMAIEDTNGSFQTIISQDFKIIEGEPPFLNTNTTQLNFNSNAGSSTFDIQSNTFWAITSNENWLSCLPNFGSNNSTITVSVLQNQSSFSRTGQLIVEGSGISIVVDVNQSGNSLGLDMNTLDNVWVYPNPTKGLLNISFVTSEVAKVSVCDIMGRVISTHANFAANTPLDLSHLDNGIYLIKIEIDNKLSVFKVSKI